MWESSLRVLTIATQSISGRQQDEFFQVTSVAADVGEALDQANSTSPSSPRCEQVLLLCNDAALPDMTAKTSERCQTVVTLTLPCGFVITDCMRRLV